jgi:hypothetical protein
MSTDFRSQLATLYRDAVMPYRDAVVPDRDSVMREHYAAMLCFAIEEAMEKGLAYLRATRGYHCAWRNLIRVAPDRYELSDAEDIATSYRDWMNMTDIIMPFAERLEREGYEFMCISRVRAYYRSVSRLPLEVAELNKQFEELERGEGLGVDEFFDAIPSPHK